MAALIAYIVFVYCTAAATGGHTLGPTCYDCHDVDDPDDCTVLHTCPSDQVCSAELHARGITPFWKFHCKKQQDCNDFSHHLSDIMTAMFGKKKRGGHDRFVCSQCCEDAICQKQSCTLDEFMGLATSPPPTTVAATKLVTNATTPTTTQTPSTTTIVTSPSTTTAPWPCLNFETTTGQCAQLQADGHCKPSADTKYEVAKLRCRSTCKFC